MQIWYNNILDNTRCAVELRGQRVRIGRSQDNDIILDSPFVAPEAAVLYKRGDQWELVALGLNEIQVNDQQLFGGGRLAVQSGQTIRLFPFTLTLELPEAVKSSGAALRREFDEQMTQMIRAVHLELLSRMDLDREAASSRRQNDEYLLTLERHLEEIARLKGFFGAKLSRLVEHVSAHCLRAELMGRLIASAGRSAAPAWQQNREWSRLVSAVPEREQELSAAVDCLSERLQLARLSDLSDQIDCVDKQIWQAWEQLAGELHVDFKRYLAMRFLKKEIKDIVFGYGPLEDLLHTPTISEIMVVDREHIYIEKNGVLESSGRRFISDEVTQAIIERIVAQVGRRIDKSRPLVDARLSDGSRVNAVIPPLAVSGPCLTIRKFPQRKLLIDDLVQAGSLTRTVAEFLRAAVIARKNILISGGTGSGKTTLLNCLSDFIPDKERIITVEDTAELQLKKEHVVRLEAKESNVEGAGAYAIRDLVKNALRMRPDRIVVGECRGPEALDMLQAMNTGHDGSLTTIHANSAEDVVLRLEVLVQMAAELPVDSIHRQISSAIDLVVQLNRARSGARRVVQVAEIVGIDPDTGGVRMKDLFLRVEGDGAALTPTGALPSFMEELIESSLVRLDTFYQ
ncbi:MAG TPA: ATPase, T2SS/T4P/T4SS family [Pirellulales bacterium]|nr:ATPase, T2SS/T4P/T4SS family [Pirellulales bacterium]